MWLRVQHNQSTVLRTSFIRFKCSVRDEPRAPAQRVPPFESEQCVRGYAVVTKHVLTQCLGCHALVVKGTDRSTDTMGSTSSTATASKAAPSVSALAASLALPVAAVTPAPAPPPAPLPLILTELLDDAICCCQWAATLHTCHCSCTTCTQVWFS